MRRPNIGNEDYETIDLTLDGDSDNEQGLLYSFLKIYVFIYALVMCISQLLCLTLIGCVWLANWLSMCMGRIRCGKVSR